MQALLGLLFVTGFYPLALAWRANRATSLSHALAWALAAWLGWGLALAAADGAAVPAARYLALCLTGCAEVAVLGARRPGVAAWNFVVGGLLVVLALSLAEGFLLRGGAVQLGGVRAAFLAGTLAVGTLNYLPTRLALAAVLLGLGCGLELVDLLRDEERFKAGADFLILLTPWAAWLAARRRTAAGPVDQVWLDFRDRYGVVWGQRLRDQFNRAAFHAGLPAELSWRGLRSAAGVPPGEETQAACLALLQALMKRFGPAAEAQ